MLEVRDVSVAFGDTVALKNFGLKMKEGEVMGVLGPSGCGKTTLLRVVAGLQPADSGDVLWGAESVLEVPPHRRGFGLMFQDFSLFPHRSVGGNVAFGLRMAGLPAERVAARVSEVLDWVGLEGYEERAVGPLSGGEQQRVALARSLAPAPRLLMLDEPVGSLDRTLRRRLVGELRELLRNLGVTAVYVTHDQEEAFSVADRVVVMRQGRVAQLGHPEEVWRRPVDEWVARFLGMDSAVQAVSSLNRPRNSKCARENVVMALPRRGLWLLSVAQAAPWANRRASPVTPARSPYGFSKAREVPA